MRYDMRVLYLVEKNRQRDMISYRGSITAFLYVAVVATFRLGWPVVS